MNPQSPRVMFRVERQPFTSQIGLHIAVANANGSVSVARTLALEAIEDGASVEAPVLTLTTSEAQALIDELWHAGLRPSEGSGSAGSLAATERHLADMRKIAFGLLRDEGVEP